MTDVAERVSFARNSTEVMRERIRFGHEREDFVPLRYLNDIEQIRQDYDPEKIRELADAMTVGIFAPEDINLSPHEISEKFKLINPLSVARFTSKTALEAYLRDHATYYGIDQTDLASITPDEYNRHHIVISGHRRNRAVLYLVDKYQLPIEAVDLLCGIYENPTFEEVLSIQARENVYEKPPPNEEALAIDRFYKDFERVYGRAPSVVECAKVFGFSHTKIRDAVAFVSLPKEVQQLCEKNADGIILLPYSDAKRLKSVQDAYRTLHRRRRSDGVYEGLNEDEYSAVHVSIFARVLVQNKLSSRSKKNEELIRNKTLEIEGLAAYQNGELFIMEEDTPAGRRKRIDAGLARTALAVLIDLKLLSSLNPEARQRLLEALSAMTDTTEPADLGPDLFAAAEELALQ